MSTPMSHPPSTAGSAHRNLVLFDAIGFQVVWLAWAWGAPAQQAFWPALGSLLFLALHLQFSPARRRDVTTVLLCVGVGFVFDTAMLQSGMLRFALSNPEPFNAVAPAWMSGLWAGLACTLHTGLAWLKRWGARAHLLSAVVGWLSYAAADRLGALSREDSLLCNGSLLVFWGVFIPWALGFSDWLARVRRT